MKKRICVSVVLAFSITQAVWATSPEGTRRLSRPIPARTAETFEFPNTQCATGSAEQSDLDGRNCREALQRICRPTAIRPGGPVLVRFTGAHRAWKEHRGVRIRVNLQCSQDACLQGPSACAQDSRRIETIEAEQRTHEAGGVYQEVSEELTGTGKVNAPVDSANHQ